MGGLASWSASHSIMLHADVCAVVPQAQARDQDVSSDRLALHGANPGTSSRLTVRAMRVDICTYFMTRAFDSSIHTLRSACPRSYNKACSASSWVSGSRLSHVFYNSILLHTLGSCPQAPVMVANMAHIYLIKDGSSCVVSWPRVGVARSCCRLGRRVGATRAVD